MHCNQVELVKQLSQDTNIHNTLLILCWSLFWSLNQPATVKHHVFWHLLEPELISLVVWATKVYLLGLTTWGKVCTLWVSESLGCPWPCDWVKALWMDTDHSMQIQHITQEVQFWRCSDTVVQTSKFGQKIQRDNLLLATKI